MVEAGWQAGDEGRPPYKLLLPEQPGEPRDPEGEALYVRPCSAPPLPSPPTITCTPAFPGLVPCV